MSRSVFQKILPKVLSALGIKGEFSEQLGGYKLDTNPSFATLFDNANDAHRFSLLAGYALSQDSMMVLSGQKFDGAMDAGIIEIELPKDFTQGQVHSAYLAARGTWPGKISGHTTKDGIMHIVVPRKTALQVAMKVNKALGNKYPVHHAEGYYAFPQKKDYDYASIQGTSSAQLPGTREDASELRAEASRLIQSELAKRGVRFSIKRDELDRAGSAVAGTTLGRQGGSERPDVDGDRTDGIGSTGSVREGSRPGAVNAIGIHYSGQQRESISSSHFGTGLSGAEEARVAQARDPRIKQRIYFYVNTGRGINPEAGVGSHAHRFELTNLYDLHADPLDIVAKYGNDLSAFESAVIDAGFNGYLSQLHGIAVLLGQRVVTPDYIGSGIKPAVPLAGRAEPSAYSKAQQALADRHDLPSGRMKGSEWQKALPEMDLSHLDQDAYYYKDALLERPRFSAQRLSLEPGNRDVVDRINRSLLGRTKIDMRPTFDDMPEEVKNAAERAGVAPDEFRGVTIGKRLYVAQDAHSSMEEVQRTIFHELYGHYGLEQRASEISPGEDFWRKINSNESFTWKEWLDALAIGRRGGRRKGSSISRPLSGTVSRDEGAGFVGKWNGLLAGEEGYFSTGKSLRQQAGQAQARFLVSFIPQRFFHGKSFQSVNDIVDSAVTSFSFSLQDDGKWHLSILDPEPGSTAHTELVRSGRLEQLEDTTTDGKHKYVRAKLESRYTTTRLLMQEAVRRLAMLEGGTPEIVVPARDTGARAGDKQAREYNSDYVEMHFSKRRDSILGQELTSEEQAVEKRFYDRIEKQGKTLVNLYLSKNGTLIDPDLVKEMSPDYQQNPERWTNAVHEPSSMLSKMIYDKILEGVDETVPVVFTAGGGGSGKSESLRRFSNTLPDTHVVFDSTLSSFDSAVKRIDKALAKGAPITVLYTNRPADKAFDFTLIRPRAIPIPVLAQAHSGAQETIHRLAEHYGDRVVFEVRNNFGDRVEDITVGNLRDIPRESYDALERRFHEIATARFESGAISADRFQAVDSGARQADEGRSRQVVGGEQAQDLGSDRQGGNRRVGEEEGGVGQRESGVVKYSSRRLADDFAEQEQFLQQAAEERGYKDVEDFLANDYQGFEKVAAEWRERNPADALFSYRRALNGDFHSQDYIVPELDPWKSNDQIVDLAYVNGKPIRLTIGGDTGKGEGKGALHIIANAARDTRRTLDQVTDDDGENAVRTALRALGSYGAVLHKDKRNEFALRLPLAKKTLILTDRGDHYQIVTMRNGAENRWGDADWAGRLTFPATEPAVGSEPTSIPPLGKPLGGEYGQGSYVSAKWNVTPASGMKQENVKVVVRQGKQVVRESRPRIIGDSGRQYTNEQKDCLGLIKRGRQIFPLGLISGLRLKTMSFLHGRN